MFRLKNRKTPLSHLCGSGVFQIGEDKYFLIFGTLSLLPVFWGLYIYLKSFKKGHLVEI